MNLACPSVGRGILAACLLVTTSYCRPQPQAPMSAESQPGATTEVRVELNPMLDPISMSIRLDGDGNITVVRYARYLLQVVALYRGRLNNAELQRLLAGTTDPAVRAALRGQKFGAGGLAQGDQFYLSVNSAGSRGECAGFIADAPAPVRNLVEGLTTRWPQLTEAAAAPAYMRSTPVEPERYEALRRAGTTRFIASSELPPDIQPSATQAVSNPRAFMALSRAQSEQLRQRISPNHECFLVAHGSAYQLTLFHTQGKAPPMH